MTKCEPWPVDRWHSPFASDHTPSNPAGVRPRRTQCGLRTGRCASRFWLHDQLVISISAGAACSASWSPRRSPPVLAAEFLAATRRARAEAPARGHPASGSQPGRPRPSCGDERRCRRRRRRGTLVRDRLLQAALCRRAASLIEPDLKGHAASRLNRPRVSAGSCRAGSDRGSAARISGTPMDAGRLRQRTAFRTERLGAPSFIRRAGYQATTLDDCHRPRAAYSGAHTATSTGRVPGEKGGPLVVLTSRSSNFPGEKAQTDGRRPVPLRSCSLSLDAGFDGRSGAGSTTSCSTH
jgi:hypothetical protein